ncbi:DUF5704 domain-containing protein [Paenibacillus sp. GCM10027629]|uniref:DUF5704 domain-containing protein n=1 Tax=Paenibacillus sp. GCM10027629 TaxID=3273414 RepID=UPI0036279D96
MINPKKYKKSLSILLTISLILLPILTYSSVVFAGGGPGSKPPINPPHFEPAGPAKSQKKVSPVQGIAKASPGIYIYQQDDLRWKVDASCNGQFLDNNSSTNKPVSSVVCEIIDLDHPIYMPTEYLDSLKNVHPKSEFTDVSLRPIYMDNTNYYRTGDPILVNVDPFIGRKAKFTMQIGGAIEPTAYRVYNFPKHEADYLFYTDLYWAALAELTKEINLTGGGTLTKGQTKQLNAAVKTKTGDGSFGPETNVNTGSGGTSTWRSSDESVATVSASGLVTAEGKGTTTITILWEKDGFQLTTTANIGVGTDPDPGGGGKPGGSGQCTFTIGSPMQSSTVNLSDMDPNANGVIKADNRDSEKFDVLKGIPTSESLFTNAFADNYLFKHIWAKMSGKIDYNCSVDVTYKREWTVPGPEVCDDIGKCKPGPAVPESDTQSKTYSFSFTRDYSYWQINNLEVYKINRASMSNYALPGGMVTMNPSGYSPPSLESKHDDSVNSHVRPTETASFEFTPPVRTGGLNSPPSLPDDTGTLKGMAQSNTPESKVNNDMVKFNNNTIMDHSEVTKDGPTPANIPNPTTIGRDVLYKPNNMISSTLLNRADTPSTGTIYYDLLPNNINGGANTQFPINGINTVTVHTPTVIYAGVSDDQEHNQKTKPNPARSAIILDRPFTIMMPTKGQHRSIPGYGNRDYQKYIKLKEVWFPFDVKTESGTFIPKKTWYSIPVSDQSSNFYLPVWVDEGDYTILFRTFAENSPGTGFTTQTNANLNLVNHVATDTVDVEVIGRVYDFRVTDVEDYLWEGVFRTGKGNQAHTGKYYWVGPNGIDGALRGNQEPFVLPILKGSNPLQGHSNITVKQGYKFKFDLKTKGNMFEGQDTIRITPTFYFVDAKGKNRQEVDLYYHTKNKYFVKVGSKDDVFPIKATLDTRLRNVPQNEISMTAGTLFDLGLAQGGSNDRSAFIQRYLQLAQREVEIGGFHGLDLSQPMKTFFGPIQVPAGVSVPRAHAAEQKWYGEYSVPTKSYIVPKGLNVYQQGRFNDKASFFLKNGYLIVNFNIETLRKGDRKNPHLQYIYAPLTNQWKREGFRYTVTDSYGGIFKLKDGDVMFYDGDQSMLDDFKSAGIM